MSEINQVITTWVATAVMEVYCRRDGLLHGHSKGLEKTKGVELTLGHVSPGVSMLDGGDPKGGLEEISMEGEADVTGVGMRIDEMEDPSVTRNLKLAMEVSNIAGLSCDGQQGLKVDCLKQIVVEKIESGGGGGSGSSDV
jgi:hypothetical protein